MIEAIGYLGSALVVTSLLMTRILRLRVISLMGAMAFLTYGVMIGSVPIIVRATNDIGPRDISINIIASISIVIVNITPIILIIIIVLTI